ncbi:MAG: 2-phospho-L-lactate transferase [Chloroflexota bacterium]
MNFNGNVVLLVGGVGGAKLAHGLQSTLKPGQLTVIVNTGDDFWHYGLRICPDLDTITYTLAGLVNKQTGWGVVGDTFTTLDTLRNYGEKPWFNLGDRDLAIHLMRTALWRRGLPLTAITAHLTAAVGVKCAVLPMTDEPVETIVHTQEYGPLPFQEYFVKHRWQPTFSDMTLEGINDAFLTTDVRSAIEGADVILIGPSNPWLSINPILSVPGMRELLRSRDVPKVAVTPIIEGRAIKGPTAKIMKELGLEVSARTVVEYYSDVITGFIYDERDTMLFHDHTDSIRFIALDTLMDTEAKRMTFAHAVLSWISDWTS